MAWTVLFLAALFEIGWAAGLKATDGFSRPWPTALVVSCMAASMVLLGLASRHLPIGTAYAVWTGIGAMGTALAGIVFYGESAGLARMACIALIAAGVIGLRLFSE